MSIDPSIALGVKPIQIESPLNQFAQVLQIQGLQNENRFQQMKADDYVRDTGERNALRSVMGMDGFDITKPEHQRMLMAASPTKAGAILDQYSQMAERRSKAEKEAFEVAKQRYGIYQSAVGALKDDPLLSKEKVLSTGRGLVDQGVLTPDVFAKISAILPDDVVELRAGLERGLKSQLPADKVFELFAPKIEKWDDGQHLIPVNVNPLSPGYTPPPTVQKVATPDAVLRSEDDAKARRQSASQFAATQSKPFEVTGSDGTPVLVRQDRNGTITPVEGYTPKAAPLKPIPATANTAIISNNQSMQRIDDALRLLSGQNVGNPAEGQLKGDTAATGWKGYLPNGVLNRLDPQGVDTRAIISDIGSLKLHDRSGAAVTASESPRLLPFIPLATDDQATVIKKLNGLRAAIVNEQQALNETYSKDQGYKPNPLTSPKSTSTPAATKGGASVSNW